jgi:uncharacterized protein YegP (UPF0339 family)
MNYKLQVYCSIADGQWYWRLVAPNGQITATGAEGYTRKSDAIRAVVRVSDTIHACDLDIDGDADA